jgi:hypothetical protein
MAFETCHLYVSRMLQQGLAGGEQFLFRIDPDTRIWRRFGWLPGFPCAFGTLETITGAFQDRIRHPPNIQGGCLGLTRQVIQGILASDALSHQRCVDGARTGWARCSDCEYIVSQGQMLDDFLISWAADAAGFPIIQHPEIGSFWRNAPDNSGRPFAVTHPHKDMEAAGISR